MTNIEAINYLCDLRELTKDFIVHRIPYSVGSDMVEKSDQYLMSEILGKIEAGGVITFNASLVSDVMVLITIANGGNILDRRYPGLSKTAPFETLMADVRKFKDVEIPGAPTARLAWEEVSDIIKGIINAGYREISEKERA